MLEAVKMKRVVRNDAKVWGTIIGRLQRINPATELNQVLPRKLRARPILQGFKLREFRGRFRLYQFHCQAS